MDNPRFLVDEADGGGALTQASADDDTGPGASTAPADTTGIDGTTGADGTTVDPSAGDSSGTTGTVEPDSTTTSTDTGAQTGTSDGTGTTGGEPVEGQVWHDLWFRCPNMMTHWASFGAVPGELSCRTSPDEPPDQWAGWVFPGFLFMDVWELEALAMVPAPGVGNSITGNYAELKLPDAVTPHLRTTVVCPADSPGCQIQGNIRVEREMEAVVGVENFVLGPGQYKDIDIDLSLHPQLLDGESFTVVLVITTKNDSPGSGGVWLYPRIVEVTG